MTTLDRDRFEIVTGSRLHFGLLDTVDPFGGVGMMLSAPTTRVLFQRSSKYAANGIGAERALEIATRLQKYAGLKDLPAFQVSVLERPDPHSGLGTGTQLAMAIAEGLVLGLGLRVSSSDMALSIAGRGVRSAVGIHGYWLGGLLYESRSDSQVPLNAVQQRIPVPEDWRILLWRPTSPVQRIAGADEVAKFDALPRPTMRARESLRAIIVDRMLPALHQNRFRDWALSVSEYNERSGQFFAAVQGGSYNGLGTETFIRHLQTEGVLGLGQSSWGPTVFALAENEQEASQFSRITTAGWELACITSPLNKPRSTVN